MSRTYFVVGVLLLSLLLACSKPDAVPAPAAPTQPAVPGPSAEPHAATNAENTVRLPWSLLGAKLDDEVVKEYLSHATGEPERDEVAGYGEFVSLYRDGIEISADTTGMITTVILYSSPENKYSSYTGPLPHSLTWDMTRADVEQAIGPPTDHRFSPNSNANRQEFFAEYPELGLYLNFDAQSETDMRAKLIDMRIKQSNM